MASAATISVPIRKAQQQHQPAKHHARHHKGNNNNNNKKKHQQQHHQRRPVIGQTFEIAVLDPEVPCFAEEHEELLAGVGGAAHVVRASAAVPLASIEPPAQMVPPATSSNGLEFEFDDLFRRRSLEDSRQNAPVTPEHCAEDIGCDEVEIVEDEHGDFSHALQPGNLDERVSIDDFEILSLVGKGAYGKVFQVQRHGTRAVYAMKVLRKEFLLQTNNVCYTLTERNILRSVRHPFVTSLHYAFQTSGKVYLVMDFMHGGQLLHHMRKQGVFPEATARIYAAELVLAIEYLHSQKVIHRDIKPENILLGADGHLSITDFGLAKVDIDDSRRGAKTFCGTMEYMAPEILKEEGHGYAVDWWSLGILLFDMLTGRPPFEAENRATLQKKIMAGKFRLPAYLTPAAHSILKGLLTTNPEKRLGSGSVPVRSHKFFEGINWNKLLARETTAPVRPALHGQKDLSCFDATYTKAGARDSPSDVHLTESQEEQFRGFSYVRSFEPTEHLSNEPSDDGEEDEDEDEDEDAGAPDTDGNETIV